MKKMMLCLCVAMMGCAPVVSQIKVDRVVSQPDIYLLDGCNDLMSCYQRAYFECGQRNYDVLMVDREDLAVMVQCK